ncbi:patatin-like phospholipase family protein [Rubrivirga sp.]|uniref:patatin-like phospholipase family protein n=1 Tax=Rubrivirga sp. TaxID=1885344 RepID=UPI003C72A3AC
MPRSAAPPSPGARTSRPKVGLVIGSGGIKCVAAVGLWRALERAGIEVDVAVGCSGGSVYAAALALGLVADDAEDLTQRLWGRSFTGVRYRSLLQVALPRVFGFSERVGLLDDRALGAVLDEVFGEASFGEAAVPLFLVASDLRTAETVVLDAGRVQDAVRASLALPLLLRPWSVGDRLLIDGGTSNPLPIDVAIREGCEVIIAMGFESRPGETIASFSGLVGRAAAIATNHLIRSTYAFYSAAHHAEIVPVMPAFDGPVRLTDAHLIPDLIRRGEEAAEDQLPYLRRLLTPTPA